MTLIKSDIKFDLKISQEPQPGPSSGKRPAEIPGSGPELQTSEYPMETRDSKSTETDYEKKKTEKSDSKEELEIDSEKSKVKCIK